MKTRPLLSAFLLSLTTSFMFIIFEPISLFVNNPDDFWFNISTVLPILLGAFAGFAAILFLILIAFELFCKKVLKKQKMFDYTLVILTAIFLITYIQGNFLSASLPGLTGKEFVWQDYPVESVLSIALWVIVFILLIFAVKKLSVKKIASYAPIVIGVILAMLTVGLISAVVTKPESQTAKNEELKVATYDNYNLVSNQQNFFIFLVDMVDSRSFNETLEDNPDYQSTFQDFTYFPDTLSYYPFTENSVPQILTDTPNYNETSYDEYLKRAYGGGYLFDRVTENGYKLNLYDSKIPLSAEVSNKFENYSGASVAPIELIKQIIRFDLYKYLPYPLKPLAKIEYCNFDASEIAGTGDDSKLFEWGDLKNYNIYKNQKLEITDDKIFSFIHLEGAHMAFNLDENMQQIDPNNGTYRQKEGATFATIKAFIERLKREDAYDNSVIIVLSDHGYGATDNENATNDVDVTMRVNPILYIKGIQETHPEMIRSDKPISFTDLGSAYNQLLQGQPSTELFADISYPRTRKFLLYDDWLSSEEMNEYQTDSTAWDVSKMTPTGVVYRTK